MAAACVALGRRALAAAGAAVEGLAGAVFGDAGSAGGASAVGAGALSVDAGAVATGAGTGLAGGCAAAGDVVVAPPPIALTACRQRDESLDKFRCRHCSDAAPPGGTLAQFAR